MFKWFWTIFSLGAPATGVWRLSSGVNVIVNLFLKCQAISKGQMKMTVIN